MPVSYSTLISVIHSTYFHPVVVIFVLIIFQYFTLSAWIGILYEALAFVHKLTLFQGYRKVNVSLLRA